MRGRRHASMGTPPVIVLAALWLAVVPGCASQGKTWGAGVASPPLGARAGRAVVNAARAPETWVPVAAALVLTIDGGDGRVSDWASTRTPLFGSRRAAAEASDDLRLAAGVAYVLTALAAPSGHGAGEVIANKTAGLGVGIGAHGATTGLVQLLKAGSKRRRPDGSDPRSFPSGHAASASVRATLAGRNLRTFGMPALARGAVRTSLAAVALGCSWARVEARVHYPTDVLSGLALGHFLGATVNDALMGSDGEIDATIGASVGRGGASLRVDLRFD